MTTCTNVSWQLDSAMICRELYEDSRRYLVVHRATALAMTRDSLFVVFRCGYTREFISMKGQ